MEKLSNAFATAHDFRAYMPSRWLIENTVEPVILEQFMEIARENKMSLYEAMTEEAKSRLADFLKSHGIDKEGSVHVSYQSFPEMDGAEFSYLDFTAKDDIYDQLKTALAILFEDIPLKETARYRNMGQNIALTYNLPDLWCDF